MSRQVYTSSGPVPDDVTVLLLDLDGTLVDTNYLHTVAWSLAFDDLGLPHRPMHEVHALIGMGAADLVERVADGRAEEAAAAHDRRFVEFLPAVHALPGAVEFLAHARASGRTVTLVTSSDEAATADLLAPLGGTGTVDDIVHGGMTDQAKPHPDPYVVALGRADVDATAALAIGDSEWDMRSASAAGIPCLGVTTGGTPRVSLYGAGAREVFTGLDQLLAAWEAFDSAPTTAPC